MLQILASGDPVGHVVQHTLVDLNPGGGFWSLPIISNHIIMQIIGAALLIWLIPKALQRRAGTDATGRLVPTGLGNAIEAVCVTLREHIFKPNLGKYTDRFTPYLWSLFFFVLVANVLGLIPLTDWLPFQHLIGGTSTANFYVTGALAAVTLVLIVYNGLHFNGFAYIKHFFMGPWWIAPLIAVIELAGLFFKAGALCIRLTANMLAGHILLAVLLGFVAAAYKGMGTAGGIGIGLVVIAGSVMVNFLEILVAFMHAFIFTMLSAVFIGMAVNIHHDEHEHDEDHAEGAVAASH